MAATHVLQIALMCVLGLAGSRATLSDAEMCAVCTATFVLVVNILLPFCAVIEPAVASPE